MALKARILRRLGGFTLDMDFSVEEGCLAILGASGCGKSMTLQSIAGIQTPDQGRITLGDRVLFDSEKKVDLPPQKRRVGYLFQNYALFPNMTVAQNIAAGLGRVSKSQARETVERMVKRFRLEGLEGRFPSQLSGGQQQRVALARILAYDPDVLLLDEPFSALDAYLREELLLELRRTLEDFRGVSVLVTHNRDEAFRISQRLMIMDQGRKVALGETRSLFMEPGTTQAARLTGCKNIARARPVGEGRVEVPDWGVTLQTGRPVPKNLTHIGIRAHDFHPAAEGEENRVPLREPVLMEGPFERQVVFTPSPESGEQVWWKLERDFWSGASLSPKDLPRELAVGPQHVLFLTQG
jgi:molybdate transport system ATP-binding protein